MIDQDLASIVVSSRSLKTIRESLCTAQGALGYAEGDRGTFAKDITHLQLLINQIDNHRPLGPDGKHGKRHTPTCGCEDKR